jgi:hypothetical protein
MKKIGLLSLFLLVALTAFTQTQTTSTLETPKRKLSLEVFGGFALWGQVNAGLHYQVAPRNQLGLAYTSFYEIGSLMGLHDNGAKGIGLYWGNRLLKHLKLELGAGYVINSFYCADDFSINVYNRSKSNKTFCSASLRYYVLDDHMSLGLSASVTGQQAYDIFNFDDYKYINTQTHKLRAFTLTVGIRL